MLVGGSIFLDVHMELTPPLIYMGPAKPDPYPLHAES